MKKRHIIPAVILFGTAAGFLQTQAQTVVINKTACIDKEVQNLPALYFDHTKAKYGKPSGMEKFSAIEKSKILSNLTQIEKSEENSRKNFQATGCVMRVSFSGGGKNIFSGFVHAGYAYQLGLYQMVCHVQQHVVKEVTEYRGVLRINANHPLTQGSFYGETGDFYVTNKSVRYEIPTDAKWNGFNDKNYDNVRFSKPSQLSGYITEDMVVNNKSGDYNNKHNEFLKLINGNGFTENWLAGDKNKTNKYKWVDRYYTITKPGIPLLVPVSRKEFLEALLEYYEMEKYNFQTAAKFKSESSPSSKSIIEADKIAYNQIYETKKARISNLLKTKNSDWLSKQAAPPKGVRENDYAKASNGLFDFYDFENGIPLYQYNPEYFKLNTNDAAKPMFYLIEFRYEGGEEKQWSENLMNNFSKNFDFAALKKMIE